MIRNLIEHSRRGYWNVTCNPAERGYLLGWDDGNGYNDGSNVSAQTKDQNDSLEVSQTHDIIFQSSYTSPYDPARHSASIMAPCLLGSVPTYCFVLVAATTRLHQFPSASPRCSPHVTGWTSPGLDMYAVLSILLPSWGMPAETEAPTRAKFLPMCLITRAQHTKSSSSRRVASAVLVVLPRADRATTTTTRMAAVALTEAMMLSSLGPISDTTHKTTIVRLVLSSANPMVVIRLLHDTQISRTTTLPKVVFCCLDSVHWFR
jgi:hypothetical protein